MVGLAILGLVLTRVLVILSGISDHFMPHGVCVEWRKDLLAIHIIGNAIVAFSYFAIPVYLGLMLRNNSEYLFDKKIVAGFAVFIFFCGMTHVFQIITVWFPAYWSRSLMDLSTGIVSLFVLSQLRGFVVMLNRIAGLQREYEELRGRVG